MAGRTVFSVAVAVALGAGPAVAADLVPHRAEYDLSLARAASGSGVTGASGDMVYRLARTCDGWRVEHRSTLNLAARDQGRLKSRWSYAATETPDGLRFYVEDRQNGRVTETKAGTARFGDEGGTAEYEKPGEKTVTLPADTLGPVGHTAAVIDAARNGKKVFTRPVFDGADKPQAYHVNAVIGDKVSAEKTGDLATKASDLLATPAWRVHLAFYPGDSTAAEPEYEVGMRLHANGVGQGVVQDYGDFAVRATLTDLEKLSGPGCGE